MKVSDMVTTTVREVQCETKEQSLIDRHELLQKNRRYWILRRAQDVFFSVLALMVLWPFMLLVAIAIVIDSPGASPIFVQDRVGRKGKVFHFYKFRSMVPNAEAKLDELLDQNEMDGPVFKMKEDPRITRVGKLIRKTSIDELPQLFNILRGDMSIVGNRPLPLYEAERLTADDCIDRFIAPAGLTGLWQVEERGKGGDMSAEERKQLDIRYGQTYNFSLDMKIIFRTLTAFVQKDNV